MVVKLLLCAYYYNYYFIYLNSLLLLLLQSLEMYGEPITITTTIARNIKKAYYYYYYFPDYCYYYYFPITITFIITVELKEEEYILHIYCISTYTLWMHKLCIIKLSWTFWGVILSNRERNSLLAYVAILSYYYYCYYYYYW